MVGGPLALALISAGAQLVDEDGMMRGGVEAEEAAGGGGAMSTDAVGGGACVGCAEGRLSFANRASAASAINRRREAGSSPSIS